MKSKYLMPFVFIFFVAIIVKYIWYLHMYAVMDEGFIIGDWLINFEAGFVRRGLSGYLILHLSDLLNLAANYTVMWIQALLFSAFMLVLFLIIYKRKIDIWFLIILLSPVTLLFPMYDQSVVGRKEILLFLVFALYIVSLNNDKYKSANIIIIHFFALLLITLFHELTFFFIPYFLLATYFKSKISGIPFRIYPPLAVISGSLIIMIPLVLFGRHINGSFICSGLMERGLSAEICNGILSWPENYGALEVFQFALSNGYFMNYVPAIFLGLIPFVLFIRFAGIPGITCQRFLAAFLICFLCSTPLFVLGIDWGRWLNIHFMLLLITFTILLKARNDIYRTSFEFIEIPHFWIVKSKWSLKISNVFFVLLSLSYLTSWSIISWGKFSLFSLKYYSKALKIIQILYDLT